MGSVNKAILVGNLGRDAEVTTTANGFPIARFSLATTDRRKDNRSGEWTDRTEWHRIVLLGKQAESLRDYLKKGKQIYVEGRIETRSWDDKDGQKRYMTEIIADRIQLLGGPGGGGGRASRGDEYAQPEYGGGGSGGGSSNSSAPAAEGPLDDDDIPF
jgi:single-strand DNA-binding protein